MSKYEPLARRLAEQAGEDWPASFAEVEAVLGFGLPKAARTGRKWWMDDPQKSHVRALAAQGWEVGEVDPVTERVIFRRSAASAAALAKAARLQPLAHPEAAKGPNPEDQPSASSRPRPPAGLITAGLALAAGVGALAVRGLIRRR